MINGGMLLFNDTRPNGSLTSQAIVRRTYQLSNSLFPSGRNSGFRLSRKYSATSRIQTP